MTYHDSDIVQAIEISGQWYYVGRIGGPLIERPSGDQCERCGNWVIELNSDYYRCSRNDEEDYEGCGAVYYPKSHPAYDTVF